MFAYEVTAGRCPTHELPRKYIPGDGRKILLLSGTGQKKHGNYRINFKGVLSLGVTTCQAKILSFLLANLPNCASFELV